MRARRAALTPQQREDAARQVALHARDLPDLRHARRIAAYLAVNGELDAGPLLHWLHAQGKELFLPILGERAADGLLFAPWSPGRPMHENRLGIPEPAHTRAALRRPMELDIVFAPLVAFDAAGNRLGMGGGYYDRSFASLRDDRHTPLLAGLGYAFQRVAALPAQPWDIPLAAVVADDGLHLTPSARSQIEP